MGFVQRRRGSCGRVMTEYASRTGRLSDVSNFRRAPYHGVIVTFWTSIGTSSGPDPQSN